MPVQGEWNNDGPMLPIEFARQSNNGRITLVIVPDKISFSSYWTLLEVKDSYEAKEALRAREEIPTKNIDTDIGMWNDELNAESEIEIAIAKWAISKSLSSVVWTALPPKFNGENNFIPTKEDVVKYLENLSPYKKEKAKEYIVKAPKTISTEYRIYIEDQLGWK